MQTPCRPEPELRNVRDVERINAHGNTVADIGGAETDRVERVDVRCAAEAVVEAGQRSHFVSGWVEPCVETVIAAGLGRLKKVAHDVVRLAGNQVAAADERAGIRYTFPI